MNAPEQPRAAALQHIPGYVAGIVRVRSFEPFSQGDQNFFKPEGSLRIDGIKPSVELPASVATIPRL
ncbi:MAG: hypothetical protein ABSD98_18150 [Candidatus Korobacteraceae bacterium]